MLPSFDRAFSGGLCRGNRAQDNTLTKDSIDKGTQWT